MSQPINDVKFYDVHLMRRREMGLTPSLGSLPSISRSLCCSFKDFYNFLPIESSISCLEFSPSGKTLVVGYNTSTLALMDGIYPTYDRNGFTTTDAISQFTSKMIFTSEHTFVRSSNSADVQFWDTRNFRAPISVFNSGPAFNDRVRDMDFIESRNLLVTNSVPGVLIAWDLNNINETGTTKKLIYRSNKPLIFKFTKYTSKLLLAQSDGVIAVVHNFNLDTLNDDMHQFSETGNSYRSEYNIIDHIDDFHRENSSRIFTSLVMHPYDKCVVARNLNYKSPRSMWLCTLKVEDYKMQDASAEIALSYNCDSPQGVGLRPPWKKSLIQYDNAPLFRHYKMEPCFTADGEYLFDTNYDGVVMYRMKSEMFDIEHIPTSYVPVKNEIAWGMQYNTNTITALKFNANHYVLAIGFCNGNVILKQPGI